MTLSRVQTQQAAGQWICFTWATFLATLAVVSASSCLAATRVRFDTATTVACRDVTTPLFTADHPEEKLIELPLRVSMLFVGEPQEKVEQLLILVEGPAGRLRVIDYYPSTELLSKVHGPIESVETTASSKSLQASLGGGVNFEYGLADVSAKPAASAGASNNKSLKETYRRRAPKDLLIASGTTNAGHGVFYKLKASDQTTLEGDQPLVIRVAVPLAWRGDWIRIECRAQAYQKHYFEKKLATVGRHRTLVGLYLMGDAEAEAEAKTLARAQRAASGVGAKSPKKKADPLRLRAISRSFSRVDDELEEEWKRLFKPCNSCPKHQAVARSAVAAQAEQSHVVLRPVKKLSPDEQFQFARKSLGRLSGYPKP